MDALVRAASDSSPRNDDGLVALLAVREAGEAARLEQALNPVCFLRAVTVVEDGEAALSYLIGPSADGNGPDHPLPNILLLDCRLPLLSGLALLCWLRNESRFDRVPVVMLSHVFSFEQTETLTRLRAAAWTLGSPPETLVQAVARSLRLILGSKGEAKSPQCLTLTERTESPECSHSLSSRRKNLNRHRH